MTDAAPAALLIATPDRDAGQLRARLRRHLPGADIRTWPDTGDPGDIAFALAWRAPQGLFAELPGLRAVSSLGAGVDELCGRDDIADDVAIGRLAGPRLAADMAAWLVAVVVGRWRRLDAVVDAQTRGRWAPPGIEPPPTIGLLGTGAMGAVAARAFGAVDLPTLGWNRRGRRVAGLNLEILAGRRGLYEIAGRSDALVNLLPLTPSTRDLLDAGLFAAMRPGSLLVNVGRGGHLVEADLLTALDRGRPGCAVLDAFRIEPLPADHPFWAHPRVLVTPHCASITRPAEAARLAAESYRRVIDGRPPLGAVDRDRGY